MRRIVLTLSIITILLGCTAVNVNIVYSEDSGGRIDIFTQKQPYGGIGLNVSSDAFGPEEIVVLYALVTYNGISVENLPVAFGIRTPRSSSFILAARADAGGIAKVNFTILTPPINVSESEVFGEWFVSASVQIGGNTFEDSLTFKVDWIVKLISVRTVDENRTYRTVFGIGGDVGLEITLRSIAMSIRKTCLAIVIQDETKVVINFSTICDFEVQPNEKLLFLYYKLHIPKVARVGEAQVLISALTALVSDGGVLYCPGISTEFIIGAFEPLTIDFRDAATVDIVPSVRSVEIGETVNISVVVRNEGTEADGFNVSAYCNGLLIGSAEATNLSPYATETLDFVLDTSSLVAGNYTLSASIPYLTNEADFTDNTLVDGVIEVRVKPPVIVHDIAISSVRISEGSLYMGELLQINVSVVNKGTETETFDILSYYNSTLIGSNHVNSLAAGEQETLFFVWNTSFAPEGFYRVIAFAPLQDDINPSDNVYLDGTVQVKTRHLLALFHDVAILGVVPSSTSVYVGEIVDIHVAVKNQGNFTESFNVMSFSNFTLIGTAYVESLGPSIEKEFVFHWNTKSVSEGNYLISATASYVPEDVDLKNNHCDDGTVKIVSGPRGWFTPDLFYWFILFLFLILVTTLILVGLCRKRKRTESAFYSGWTAWYYCYDPRGKMSKYPLKQRSRGLGKTHS